MKVFFLFFILFFSVISGCSGRVENYLRSNLSEKCEFILAGNDNDISANLMCGYREKNYIINGESTELIEYGVITFKINEYDKDIVWYYEIMVGMTKHSGILEINPFDNSLVADIGKIIDKSELVSARIISNDLDKKIDLIDVGKDYIVNSDDIISIVAKNYKDNLENFIVNDKFLAEVYVKLIEDSDDYSSEYYWCFKLHSKDGRTLSVLISPTTGELLASSI